MTDKYNFEFIDNLESELKKFNQVNQQGNKIPATNQNENRQPVTDSSTSNNVPNFNNQQDQPGNSLNAQTRSNPVQTQQPVNNLHTTNPIFTMPNVNQVQTRQPQSSPPQNQFNQNAPVNNIQANTNNMSNSNTDTIRTNLINQNGANFFNATQTQADQQLEQRQQNEFIQVQSLDQSQDQTEQSNRQQLLNAKLTEQKKLVHSIDLKMAYIATCLSNCRQIYTSDQIESVKHRMVGLELCRGEGETELLPIFLNKFLINGETITRRNNMNTIQQPLQNPHQTIQDGTLANWCGGFNSQSNNQQQIQRM